MTIPLAAQCYKIAPIRIHGLVRQRLIPTTLEWRRNTMVEPRMLVCIHDIDRYFADNPGVLEEWQNNYAVTQKSRYQ